MQPYVFTLDILFYFLIVQLPDGPIIQVIAPGEETYDTIARRFFVTLPDCKIISIKKIQNRVSWNTFRDNVSRVSQERLNVKALFHGSSETDPNEIIESNIGYDVNFSRIGLWGRGIYFAESASYADNYAFRFRFGERCIFLSQVFIGDSCYLAEDREIISPPTNYHSVEGEKNGNTIYVLYDNSLAYPSYLITYRH